MAAMKLTVKGIDTVNRNLLQLARQMPVVAAQSLNGVAEETMTDAKRRTPVETGTLKRSGKVHKHATPRRLVAELSFGTEYAIAVHEHPSKHSPPTWKGKVINWSQSGTGPKFLENAIKFTALWFEERIANDIRMALSKGDTRRIEGSGAGSPGGTGNI